eukprot:1953840-Ditylum_brightwellii.AAC.1
MVGMLNWLAISTQLDLATIVNILAKYMGKPSQGHIKAAKRVAQYVKGTTNLGITFHSDNKMNGVEAYIKFPLKDDGVAMSNANWGPQDARIPRSKTDVALKLFKTRSILGFFIWYHGPIHWVSKRQSITAQSSAKSKIYATDKCTKVIQALKQIVEEMELKDSIMKSPTIIYNNTNACICWTKNLTTKGLRHIQIQENTVREAVHKGEVVVKHIAGDANLSDMFTKEEKNSTHFLLMRDTILEAPPEKSNKSPTRS